MMTILSFLPIPFLENKKILENILTSPFVFPILANAAVWKPESHFSFPFLFIFMQWIPNFTNVTSKYVWISIIIVSLLFCCFNSRPSLLLTLSSTSFSSVQFSHSVLSDSLRPHELQHTRPSCPSATPRVHSNSRPSSPWCHPAISCSVVPFSSCPQSLPASESFPMSQLLHEVAKVLEFQHHSFQRTISFYSIHCSHS